VVQPERRARGVGQVALVEHLERGLAAGEFGQHRVGAGAGQARVQQLYDDINFLDALADGFFGQVHVTGKPLDGHQFSRGARGPSTRNPLEGYASRTAFPPLSFDRGRRMSVGVNRNFFMELPR
jgi:hypothetical protein